MTPEQTEEQASVDLTIDGELRYNVCPACGGSGIGGYVTPEMASDAGAPEMVGMPEPCYFGCPMPQREEPTDVPF